MGYGVFKADGEWPPAALADGDPIGWHYRASAEECEPNEVYIEDDALLDGMSTPRWDGANGVPRIRTEEEMTEEARDATLQRVASEAEGALAEQFVNPNDVIGLLADILYKKHEDLNLDDKETQALAFLKTQYNHAENLKDQIDNADPKDLSSIKWE